MVFGYLKTRLPDAETALKGRSTPLPRAKKHFVLRTVLDPDPGPEHAVIMFGMGCFWGAEKIFWQTPGVYTTMVGYAGGYTPNPTYEEVCSGGTGHIEVVRILYFPKKISCSDLMDIFWQSHDPRQGMRQGVDIGTQYRSAVFYFDASQKQVIERSRETFLDQHARTLGKKPILTTEILAASPFYFAEAYHQQYLAKQEKASYSV